MAVPVSISLTLIVLARRGHAEPERAVILRVVTQSTTRPVFILRVETGDARYVAILEPGVGLMDVR